MNIRTFKSIVIRKGFKIDETEDFLIVFKKLNGKYVSGSFLKSKLNEFKLETIEQDLYFMEVELSENI